MIFVGNIIPNYNNFEKQQVIITSDICVGVYNTTSNSVYMIVL